MEAIEILRRVGLALLLFFGIHAVLAVADFATDTSHSFTIDLTALVLGILLRYGSLGAARVTTFAYAFQLVAVAATLAVGVPIAFWVAREQLATLPLVAIVWIVISMLLDGLFAYWVVAELRDPAVEAALAAARRGTNRRASLWGGGVAVGLAVIGGIVGLAVYSAWPRWTAPAVAAAHAQLGDDWKVSVQSMSMSNAGWRAHVVAHRGGEVKELDLKGP